MDKLGNMKIFVSVAQAAGFAKAAARASLSTAAVSRAIMELESSLQTRPEGRSFETLTGSGFCFVADCRLSV